MHFSPLKMKISPLENTQNWPEMAISPLKIKKNAGDLHFFLDKRLEVIRLRSNE
jgi:hypothetical protein